MGLHTGEGALGGDNYSGIDVNRAARVAGAASGGQVIVSDATRILVEREVPAGVSLRDLGVHRLRDLNLPMRLYDLVVEGLPADFPAPRTLDARPGNLPAQLTSFVGRERRPPRSSASSAGPGWSPSPAPAAPASPGWPSTSPRSCGPDSATARSSPTCPR
jgi:hypothetical protein